jgi:hypothetical protein
MQAGTRYLPLGAGHHFNEPFRRREALLVSEAEDGLLATGHQEAIEPYAWHNKESIGKQRRIYNSATASPGAGDRHGRAVHVPEGKMNLHSALRSEGPDALDTKLNQAITVKPVRHAFATDWPTRPRSMPGLNREGSGRRP